MRGSLPYEGRQHIIKFKLSSSPEVHTKYLYWPRKAHGRIEESVNLCIEKEGLRRAFPGTGNHFEVGDMGWFSMPKYYFMGSRETNVHKPINQFTFSVKYIGWQ